MRRLACEPVVEPAQLYIAWLKEESVKLAEELGVILGQLYAPGRLMVAQGSHRLDTAPGLHGAVTHDTFLETITGCSKS